MDQAFRVLRDTFGHEDFRLQQEQVVHSLVEDSKNTLVLFPTGGGKSLTYQVPALCLDGLTLVISPLLALIKDQVDALQRKGVKAANLDSTLDAAQSAAVKNDVRNGTLKLLYVAPERLNNEGFVELIRHVKISVLAVDESHCISQWGSSFRPDYLKIARFAKEMEVERVLCLTATATPTVIHDICEAFDIEEDRVYRTSMYRPNLSFEIRTATNLADKVNQVLPLLQARTGPCILYVTLQRHAVDTAAALTAKDPKLTVWAYHGGLPTAERQSIQDAFMASDDGIVCATIAFGMGVDKANIRQVHHLYMAKTLENYSQEVGRAGRDDLPSQCYMYLSPPDIPILEGFGRGDTPSRTSLELWLNTVALKSPDEDGTLSFNHYDQAKIYDIRANVLNLLYASLELGKGEYIRAITPMYSNYDLTVHNASAILADAGYTAKIIRKFWSPKRNGSGYTIDLVNAADSTPNVLREELSKRISMWEMDGHCSAKGSQVRARYRVLHALPKDAAGIKLLAGELYDKLVAQEEDNITKLKQVIEFATVEDCLASHIATHFGDPDAIPGGMCGTCTFCRTAEAVEFTAAYDTTPNPILIRAVLGAIPDRDDPLMLTRFAFGVTSPRLTANKTSTAHPLFGSMCGTEWKSLLEAFDAACKAEDYRVVVTQPSTGGGRGTGTKRKVATGSGSRGSSAKRGRW